MKNKILLLLSGMFLSINLSAQIVDVESTTQGIIFPRVTSTGNVSAPAEGMVVYQTTDPEGLYQYDGAAWSIIGGSGGSSSKLFLMLGWVSGALSERWTFLNSGFFGGEGFAQHHMPYGGKLTNLQIKPLGTIVAGATALLTVRVNGSDTNLQLSFNNADGTILKEDLDEVAVSKGDLVCIRLQEIGNESANTYYSISLELQ